ncbi:XRE family transcriptional regulator [Micromonospora sp. NPDC126480]|uniref:helix-turn-helix domain-containing protein n=1 Tax=Micromonospora sp. NPDC126480 TaxID=3155312 RepID=UPI003333FB27
MAVSRELLADRIRAAMNEAGMTQQQLADSIDIDASALSRALSCQRNFKSLEVALIAETLRVSVQSLLSEQEQPAVLLAARAQPDTSPALASALARTEEYVELDRLLADLGFAWAAALGGTPEEVMGSPHQQGAVLSVQLRSQLGVGDEVFPYELSDFADLLEKRLGIDIGFEPLPAGLDGLSVSSGGFRLALVNSGISATRQRFTLAHEIGHLFTGDSQALRIDENVFGRKNPDEERANAFAAAFLMPEDALKAAVPRGYVSEDLVAELLSRYGVSLDALAFRLHNIGVINAAGRDRIRSMSSTRIALRSGRTSDLQARGDRRVPGNLLYRSVEAYVQGKISVKPLARLLSVEPDQLLDELAPFRRRDRKATESLEPAL